MLSQFTGEPDQRTLAEFLHGNPGFFPAGRLDYDSEGLLLLTNQGPLQHRIAHPDMKMAKRYWVQTTSELSIRGIEQLRTGVQLKDGPTKPASVKAINQPASLWAREQPVAPHRDKLSGWLELEITEGRNRQVRRMLAALDCPVLRLIRVAVGPWSIENLNPGEHRKLQVHLPESKPTKRRR